MDLPLAPAELERSLRRNQMAGFFGMFWMTAAIGVPLPLFMRAMGASGTQLGLLACSWQIALLAQIVSALVVESFPRRKPYWAAVSLSNRVLWIVPALLPWLLAGRRELWPWIMIATLAVANLLGQMSTAPWQSWIADLVPSERASRFWGERQRIVSIALALAAFCYGLILDRQTPVDQPFLGFQIVFAAATVFGIADILIHTTVHEPAPTRHLGEARLLHRLRAPLQQPGFLRFTVAMGIWTGAQAMLGYTLGLPGFFSMVYLKEQFGTSYAQAAVVFVSSAVGAALWTPYLGRLLERFGSRRMLQALLTTGPLLMLSWLALSHGVWNLPFVRTPVPQPVLFLSAISLLIGGVYSGTWVCQVRFTQQLTAPTGRTVAMALHWTLVGLIALAGPLLAGLIKDHFSSAHLTYFQLLILLHLALAWGAALPLLRALPGQAG